MSTFYHRKCAKCGKTRAQDNFVTYHRFPDPGKNNFTKALAWATYCWPDQQWTHASLVKLNISSKVLCGRHFALSQFYDDKRQKLSKFAVPNAVEVEDLLNARDNVYEQQQSAELCMPRPPFARIENVEQPSTSFAQTFKPQAEVHDKENFFEQNTGQLAEQLTQCYTTNIEDKCSTSAELSTQETVKVLFNSKENKTPELRASHSKKKRSSILGAIDVGKLSELNTREKKLYKVCRQKITEIMRLRNKLKHRKVDVINQVFENENVKKLCDLNISNSFIVLLQSQLKNCPKKPKARRYNLEQKIMSLVIFKKSPACYRLLRRMFALPSQSSLNKLLNKIPLKPGINNHIFSSLKHMSAKQTDDDNVCILSFDEMSIRKHLVYDSKQDIIFGFQDHGDHGRNDQIATKALVFMLAGIRKKWKQPIAFYYSSTINADRMTVIVKQVLTECFNAGLNVVATVCDLSTVNIKVLKTLGVTTRDPYFMHCEREIVAVLDPPHLLKCTRNMFMKHDVECMTDIQINEKLVKGIAKWSHIKEFYNLDKNNLNFVFAPALTDHHLNPNIKQKMRVKLAAQVLSHSVTGGLLTKIALNELPQEALATAAFTQKFDELFDAVNADSPDLRRGKKYATNITSRSPHMKLFEEMKTFISEMKYLGNRSKPPSQDGWIHTLNAIQRLWENLLNVGIKSLPTRRLNQDPLENCFGCIRYNCGSNNNPTIQQFVAGIKTAILSNLRHSGQKKNCEDDTATLTDNMSNFLTNVSNSEKSTHSDINFNYDDILLADAVEAVEEATPEGQACAYVCGFIYKKLRHNHCRNCKKVFLSENIETVHIFTSLKEYGALNYANKAFVQSVEIMATLTQQYLKDNAWKENIKSNVLAGLEVVDVAFLNNCKEHFDINKYHVKSSVFHICINRFLLNINRNIDEKEKKEDLQRKLAILRNK